MRLMATVVNLFVPKDKEPVQPEAFKLKFGRKKELTAEQKAAVIALNKQQRIAALGGRVRVITEKPSGDRS